jgi:hypothetical protein
MCIRVPAGENRRMKKREREREIGMMMQESDTPVKRCANEGLREER